MSELERDIGLAEVELLPLRRPRYVLTRHRAALFVVLGYLGMVAFVAGLLVVLERLQHYDDQRNLDGTLIFAGVMALPLGWALFNIYRRAKLPDWPS